MNKKSSFTIIGLLSNLFLFIIKVYFGLISGSLALLSDAVNSFTDILASIGIHLAVKEGEKTKDSDHPYGHHAAEPISALMVSILAAVLAFEILRNAVENISVPALIVINEIIIGVVVITILAKGLLYLYFKNIEKTNKGQAVKAYIIDSINDVWVSSVVFAGVLGAYYGYPVLDDIAAIVISLYIFRNAFNLGKKNINFLMGGSPENKILVKISKLAGENKDVKQVNDLRAHYFGDTLHVELTIKVDKKLNVVDAHDIGEKVRQKILKLESVSNVNVHVEPF